MGKYCFVNVFPQSGHSARAALGRAGAFVASLMASSMDASSPTMVPCTATYSFSSTHANIPRISPSASSASRDVIFSNRRRQSLSPILAHHPPSSSPPPAPLRRANASRTRSTPYDSAHASANVNSSAPRVSFKNRLLNSAYSIAAVAAVSPPSRVPAPRADVDAPSPRPIRRAASETAASRRANIPARHASSTARARESSASSPDARAIVSRETERPTDGTPRDALETSSRRVPRARESLAVARSRHQINATLFKKPMGAYQLLYQLVPARTSWYELILFSHTLYRSYQLVPAGTSWYQLVNTVYPYVVPLVPARTSSYQLVNTYCLAIRLARSDIRLVPSQCPRKSLQTNRSDGSVDRYRSIDTDR